MGLVALWHMGSSWTRDGTRVPCIARWILNHWTTREAVGNVLIALCGGTPLIFTITQKVNFIAFYFHFASQVVLVVENLPEDTGDTVWIPGSAPLSTGVTSAPEHPFHSKGDQFLFCLGLCPLWEPLIPPGCVH